MNNLKILMIGAHFDDCDFRSSGLAAKYRKLGHEVRFLSMTTGGGGHHVLKPREIIKRRKIESQKAAKILDITYDNFGINDCEVIADLKTRKRLIRYIRKYSPDLIITHRNNDYHADHRNTSLLVQDASYLLTVPNYCSDTPAMEKMPVIAFFFDKFNKPPFKADVVIDVTSEVETFYQVANCHESQIYEWLAFSHGEIDSVPTNTNERIEWYRSPRVPRDKILTVEELTPYLNKRYCEGRLALPASLFRNVLIKRYGEKGNGVLFAEAFEISEYGAPLTLEEEKKLFPF